MGSQCTDQLFIVAFFDNSAAASIASRAAVQGGAVASDPLDVGLLALDARGRLVVSMTWEDNSQRDRGLQVAVSMLGRAAAHPDPIEPDPTKLAPLDLTTEDVTRIVAELEAGQGAVALVGDRSDGQNLVFRLTGLGGRVEVHGFTDCPSGDADDHSNGPEGTSLAY